MHFCTAVIALQGDDQQQVYRNEYAPISWPEIDVIQALHGEDAVRQVIPFAHVEQEPRTERERLRLIYGDIVTRGGPEQPPVYPGSNPSMRMEAPEYTLRPGIRWLNPLSGLEEILQEDGSSTPAPIGRYRSQPQHELAPVQPGETVGDPRPDPEIGGRMARRRPTAQKYDDNAEFA